VAGSAVCGRAAAALHRLTGFRPSRPELVVPRTASARNELAVVRRYEPGRTTKVDGIAVVSPAQALVDSAASVPVRRLARALDDLVVADPAKLDLVRARFLAARGRRGLGELGRVLAERGEGHVPSESELEDRLRTVVAAPGLPPLTWQAPRPCTAGRSVSTG
jgi:hypothetical protein